MPGHPRHFCVAPRHSLRRGSARLICRAMMSRRIFVAPVLVACVLVVLGGTSHAQVPAPAAASPAPAQATPAPAAVDELQRLVERLTDANERAKLVAQLQALIAAQRGLDEKETAERPGTWLDKLSDQIDAVSAEIVAVATVVLDAPRWIDWFRQQASDADARRFWINVSFNLIIVFGIAVVAEWILRQLLRRPRTRLQAQSNGSRLAQALLLLLLLTLEALPILTFAAVAYLVLPLVNPHPTSSRVAGVIIEASLVARLILAVAHVALLSPGAVALYTIGEETRNYLYIWARRFTSWAVYGYALATVAWWLGVPGAVYVLVLRSTMLVLGVLAVIFVLQNRAAVAEMLRGQSGADGQGNGPIAPGRGWLLLRQRLADTWHVLAIAYIVGIFGNYVLNIEAGFAFVFRVTLMSVVILTAAGIIVSAVRQLSHRGFAIGQELKTRFPTLETRANRYLPVLTILVSVVVYFFAVLALLQVWGLDAFAWFSTTFGRKITGGTVSIITVVLMALVVWELFGSAVERYLNGMAADGRRVARSARTRTLLPLLRTTMLIVLVTIVGLIVLSELGLNIVPLLAGAGVAGIAVGFGSQALVKDVITGLFILLEDTLAIGDVVDVGKGHVGVVEAISIRTIKLRDASGTMHTVPFSEVATVRNMTRDYAYFVCDVGVQLREDPDRVVAVVRDVADELRKDAAWSESIVEPLDVVGVDRFTDSAMVIQVRLKCLPLRQWAVGHEFNRRMKQAFDRHGIEMPAINQTRYLPQPAPAAPAAPA
jgi:small-conductance mechanosensitive channel